MPVIMAHNSNINAASIFSWGVDEPRIVATPIYDKSVSHLLSSIDRLLGDIHQDVSTRLPFEVYEYGMTHNRLLECGYYFASESIPFPELTGIQVNHLADFSWISKSPKVKWKILIFPPVIGESVGRVILGSPKDSMGRLYHRTEIPQLKELCPDIIVGHHDLYGALVDESTDEFGGLQLLDLHGVLYSRANLISCETLNAFVPAGLKIALFGETNPDIDQWSRIAAGMQVTPWSNFR